MAYDIYDIKKMKGKEGEKEREEEVVFIILVDNWILKEKESVS